MCLHVKKSSKNLCSMLNLKELNKYIKFEHFKVFSCEKILNIVPKNSFMNCNFFILFYHLHVERFSDFLEKANFNQSCCLYLGLPPAPRHFTEVMKPSTSFLVLLGYEPADFIDEI